MAKKIELLSAVKVRNLKGPGYFADGGNLYFRIALGGACGWIFRYAMAGKTRDMGLGGFPEISLAAARKHAEECRALPLRREPGAVEGSPGPHPPGALEAEEGRAPRRPALHRGRRVHGDAARVR
jgi:hypothetical protein